MKNIREHLWEMRSAKKSPNKEKIDCGVTSTFEKNGKIFDTIKFNSESAANSYIEKIVGNGGDKLGVIGKQGEMIHVAKDNEGGDNVTVKQSDDGYLNENKFYAAEKEFEKMTVSGRRPRYKVKVFKNANALGEFLGKQNNSWKEINPSRVSERDYPKKSGNYRQMISHSKVEYFKEEVSLDENEPVKPTEWNKIQSASDGDVRSVFKKDGKMYQTYCFNTESDANNFLKSRKGYGIIGRNGYQVHVARKAAVGRVVDNPKVAKKQKSDGTLNEGKKVSFSDALEKIAKKYKLKFSPSVQDALGEAYMLGNKNTKSNYKTPEYVKEENQK